MKKLIALPCFFFLIVGASQAQYLGPKEAEVRSENVAWVLDHARFLEQQDAVVYLSGFIIKQIGKEKYVFRDDTGLIRVEIDEKNMPNEPFDDRTRVMVRGELETLFMESPEIDVAEITIAPAKGS
jgi:uncharacterized protein (TIGR00156 family)